MQSNGRNAIAQEEGQTVDRRRGLPPTRALPPCRASSAANNETSAFDHACSIAPTSAPTGHYFYSEDGVAQAIPLQLECRPAQAARRLRCRAGAVGLNNTPARSKSALGGRPSEMLNAVALCLLLALLTPGALAFLPEPFTPVPVPVMRAEMETAARGRGQQSLLGGGSCRQGIPASCFFASFSVWQDSGPQRFQWRPACTALHQTLMKASDALAPAAAPAPQVWCNRCLARQGAPPSTGAGAHRVRQSIRGGWANHHCEREMQAGHATVHPPCMPP